MLRNITNDVNLDVSAIKERCGFGSESDLYAFYDTEDFTEIFVTYHKNSQMLGIHACFCNMHFINSEQVSINIRGYVDSEFGMLKEVEGLSRLKDFEGLDLNNKRVLRNIVKHFYPLLGDMTE